MRSRSKYVTPARHQLRRCVSCIATALLTFAITLNAQTTRTKANNTTNLNLIGSWVGGVVPGSTDIALWNSTVTAANTVSLGANLNFGEIQITNPGGLVTINSGNTLTLSGVSGVGIDMSSATQNLTINSAVALGSTQIWNVGSARTLTIGGIISGSGNGITKTGSGTLVVTGVTNTYTGPTTINDGTLTLQNGAQNVSQINSSSALVLGGGTLNDVLVNRGLLTFASTTFNTGDSSVTTSGGGGQGASLNFAGITRNIGSTVDFTITGTNVTATTTTANANFTGGSQTILGGYATVGGNTWAVSAGNGTTAGNITGLATYNTGFAAGTNVNATTGTSTPGAMTINSLRFNSVGAYTVNTSGNLTIATGGILETAGVGANAVSINNNNLTSGNGQDLIVIQNNASGNMTIGSNIVDNGTIGVTKSGAGTLILTGANTYTGTTTINAGTLQIGAAGTTGTLGSGGAVVDNAALSFNRTNVLTVGNTISGTGTVTQAGSGTTTLTAANTYTGGTTVSAGTLFVNNTTGSGTGTGAVVVNGSGTTLGGTGTISGAVQISNTTAGAILNPGANSTTAGTLTTGALTLSSTNANTFHIDAFGTLATDWDKLTSTAAIVLGGTASILQVNIASGLTFTPNQTYVLLEGTSLTGTFNGINDNDVVTFAGYQFIADYTATGFDLIAAVPEPSTWFAAVLAIAAIGFSQRKRLRVCLRVRRPDTGGMTFTSSHWFRHETELVHSRATTRQRCRPGIPACPCGKRERSPYKLSTPQNG